MAESKDLGGLMARVGSSLRGIPEKEFGSILSTAHRHTGFIDSYLIITNTDATSFDVRSLASTPTSLYLILPAQYIHSHANLMRLWINALLLVVKQAGPGEDHELLLMLDEVAQLGEMRPLEEAVTLLRGFGVRLWFICQSLNQLEAAYPGPRAKTLLANFGIQQYFGIADLETATHVSKTLGNRTEVAPTFQAGSSDNRNGGQAGGFSWGRSRGTSHSAFGRELMKPEEVLQEDRGLFIIRQGRFPILADRATYYADPEFSDDPNAPTRPRASAASIALCALGGLAALNFAMHLNMSEQRPNARVSSLSSSRPTTDDLGIGELFREAIRQPAAHFPAADIAITCPRCGNEGQVPASYAGQRVNCQECRTLLEIPNPNEEELP